VKEEGPEGWHLTLATEGRRRLWPLRKSDFSSTGEVFKREADAIVFCTECVMHKRQIDRLKEKQLSKAVL